MTFKLSVLDLTHFATYTELTGSPKWGYYYYFIIIIAAVKWNEPGAACCNSSTCCTYGSTGHSRLFTAAAASAVGGRHVSIVAEGNDVDVTEPSWGSRWGARITGAAAGSDTEAGNTVGMAAATRAEAMNLVPASTTSVSVTPMTDNTQTALCGVSLTYNSISGLKSHHNRYIHSWIIYSHS